MISKINTGLQIVFLGLTAASPIFYGGPWAETMASVIGLSQWIVGASTILSGLSYVRGKGARSLAKGV